MSDETKFKELTVKQKRFAHEYFEGKSGVDAVKAAGYNVTNNNSAAAQASRLLHTEPVRNYLQHLMFQTYPDAPNLMLSRLVEIISSKTSKDSDANNSIKILAELCGLKAPSDVKKSANVNFKPSDLDLPKE